MTAAPTNGRASRLQPVPTSPAATSAPIASALLPGEAGQAGDAVAILKWGARRYAWLVLACIVGVGIFLPLQQLKQKEMFTAESLVVASTLTADTSILPRYGAAVFDNGQVALGISDQFGDGGDAEDVVPRRVSVVTEQDSLVFRVQGHARDAQTAADLADAAADVFVDELNEAGAGIGTFVVQSTAVPPVESDEPLRAAPYAVSVGLVAGLVTGLGVLMLLLVLRRPVVDAAGASRATDLPVFGSVTLPRSRRHDVKPDEVAGLAPLCRQVLDWSPESVVLTGPDSFATERHRLAQAICDAFEQVRHVAFAVGSGKTSHEGPVDPATGEPPGVADRGAVNVIDGARAIDLVAPGRQTFVLLVVPMGIRTADLRNLAGELKGVPAAIVLVRTRRRRRRASSARSAQRSAYDEEPHRGLDDPPDPDRPPPAAPDPAPGEHQPAPADPTPAATSTDLLSWVAAEAADWFPRLAGPATSLQVVRTRERAGCRILEIELRGRGGVERLVVKARVPETSPPGERPTLAPPVAGEVAAARAEFLGLQSMYESLTVRPSRGLAPVRPYGLCTDHAAVAMEHVAYPSLHDVLQRAAWSVGGTDVPSAMIWSHAGDWIKRYHALLPTDGLPEVRGSCFEVLDQLNRLLSYLTPRVGLQGLLDRFCDQAGEAAELFVGDGLPTCVAHGDFDVQNVLVRPDGSVAVLAPSLRYRAPVFEDLGRLLVSARYVEPDSLRPDYRSSSPRPRLSEAALLAGYFGADRVPVGAMRVFLALCTLDRWADDVSRQSAAAIRRPLRSFQVAAVSRHYVRELRDQMRLLLPSSRGWSDSWV